MVWYGTNHRQATKTMCTYEQLLMSIVYPYA